MLFKPEDLQNAGFPCLCASPENTYTLKTELLEKDGIKVIMSFL